MMSEFRLVSLRRLPKTCAAEFTRNVVCQSRTVEQKKPTTRPDHPPIMNASTPNVHGAIQSCLLMNRSSGYLAKSLIASVGVALYLSARIQPTWLHQKPLSGEWMSRSVSE